MSEKRGGAAVVSLLEADPDLADRLPADQRAAARTASAVRVERLAVGTWEPSGTDGFGLLVLSGFLVRRVGREGWFGAEILGPGDLLRP